MLVRPVEHWKWRRGKNPVKTDVSGLSQPLLTFVTAKGATAAAAGESRGRRPFTGSGNTNKKNGFILIFSLFLLLLLPPPAKREAVRNYRQLYGVYWVLLGFTRYYQVLLGFTEFYWVLLGSTRLCLVLLGFTRLSWVLLDVYWV